MAIRGGVGLIEHSHSFYAILTRFEDKSHQCVGPDVGAGGLRQRINHKAVDIGILIALHKSMVGISGHPFQAVDNQLFQRTDIGIGLP